MTTEITPLERTITFEPAFDKRAPEPSKNYGIHGVTCNWILKGPKGGIIWMIFTNWMLPHVTAETHARVQRGDVDDISLKCRYEPSGATVEAHGLAPQYDGQELRSGCLLVPGGVCYTSTWFGAADDLLELLIEKGGEAVWKDLESRYDDLPEPEATS